MKNEPKQNAIVLLSGGLDSLVSISQTNKKYDIKYAITFDYGQNSLEQELHSSKMICKHYSIQHKIVKLNWLKELLIDTQDWIPNRNGAFLNIAACFAEHDNIKNVIIGVNKEEANDFKDNSRQFLSKINASLKNSTNSEVKVIAPLKNRTKEEIVKLGIKSNAPLKFVYSCYKGQKKHCGNCRSCLFLKKALEENNRIDLLKKLF